MNAASGAPSASPLTIHSLRGGGTTCLTMLGRVDASNRERFSAALLAADGVQAGRVELDLTRLESCDVDAAFELAAFASEVRDRGGQVKLVGANRWVLTMLTLADVAGALVVPSVDAPAPVAPRLIDQVSPHQAVALRWLLDVLDHDGAARDAADDGRGSDARAASSWPVRPTLPGPRSVGFAP